MPPGRHIVKQKKQEGKVTGREDRGKTSRNKNKEAGRTLKGFNRRTGERERYYTCNSEYHYAPQRPQKENRSSGPTPFRRVSKKPSNQPFPSIAMESPLKARVSNLEGQGAPAHKDEHFFSTTLEVGGQCLCA